MFRSLRARLLLVLLAMIGSLTAVTAGSPAPSPAPLVCLDC
ncbi:hypothetical protein [Deinococcus taeanensis]|nr:hypothetical protein [Deinococcus taeanensis]